MNGRRFRFAVLLSLTMACGGASSGASKDSADAKAKPEAGKGDGEQKASDSPLTVEFLRRHIEVLSHDDMEGRRPGSPGGAKAVAYIKAQMEALGLKPAGDNGGFTQAVPMRALRLDPERSSLKMAEGKGEPQPLQMGKEIVAGSMGPAGTHQIDAPLVFLGYGVSAPEHDWDDYEGVDLRGKIAVVFVGDPPVTDGRFGGPAMTYYGRWTHKFERALEAGAAGCLVVHETEPASYGWNVVESSWSGERFALGAPGGESTPALDLQGWMHRDLAERLAKSVGDSLEGWHEKALSADFKPVELPQRLVAEVVTTERGIEDVNVLGSIPGRDKPEEHVLITAHWDHLGVKPDPKPGEDAIFNGAVDNASGIAGMLGVAAALQQRVREGKGPSRSVTLLATTAEEQGLLGSKHFAAHPLMPLESIVAVANLDSMNVQGRTKTVAIPGKGQTTLEDVLDEIVQAQGRRVIGDERPQAGSYYRSDHFSLAKRGVPAITFHGGKELEEGGVAAGEALAAERAKRYHTVDDEYDAAWPLTGALQDAEAVLELVARVADAAEPPQWTASSEFAKLRPPK